MDFLNLISQFVFCAIVGLFASAVAIVEILTASKDSYEAMWTKEALLLYVLNVFIAGLVAYVLVVELEQFSVGVLSAIAIIFGYPSLLHQKFFALQSTSWGFEEAYQKVSNWLTPGIDDSIQEQGASYLRDFKEKLPTDKLVARTKEYLETRDGLPSERKAKLQRHLDELLRDTNTTPQNEGKNNAVIFVILKDIGGYRIIRRIRKQILKEAS